MIESECCDGRMIGEIQCEVCGSDGKLKRIQPIRWSQLQKEKEANRKNKIIREVIITTAIIIGVLIAMGVGGKTYPY